MPPSDNTLRFHFETVYTPARLAGRHAQTKLQYGINLRRFEAFLGRPALLSDLNDQTVNAAVAWLKENGGLGSKRLSPASADKFRDNLCSVWRYFNQIRLVDTIPSVPVVVVPQRIPEAWTRSELDRLWQALARIPGELAGVPANLWFLTLHMGIWDSGCRIGELLALEWKDVDLAGGFFITRAENRKGGLSDKLHKLAPETNAFLRRMLAPKRDRVWPWPYRSQTYLHTVYKRILEAAGLPFHGQQNSFHKMRKSVASHVKAAGGNAQEALGHSDARMTEANYIDPRIAPRQFASDVLFRPGGFVKPPEAQKPDPKAQIQIYREGLGYAG